MDENIFQRLQGIFREVFMDPTLQISGRTSPKEIPEWDSVAQVNIVLSVEMEFGFRLTTSEVSNIHKVDDLLGIITHHIPA
jgi:acyl carrier protein